MITGTNAPQSPDAGLLAETLISIPRAAREMPGGRVNAATAWRWATHGVRGVVLETIVVGGRRRLTSREAIRRFVVATSAAAGQRVSDPTAGQRAAAAGEQLKLRLARRA